MNEKEFNKYLDNLLVQAKLEHEGSKFTQKINKVISEFSFDESKQAFLFISIDNADQAFPDSFTACVGDKNGCALLLQAISLFVEQLEKRISENNND